MTVTVANTLVNNTWDFWRLRTNQMADVITRQAVTVGGNAAVGTAVIDGNLQTTNTYTRYIAGGTITTPADLVIGTVCRMSVDAYVTANFYSNTGNFTTVTATGDVNANRLNVGNTVIRGANVTTGNYFGTWSGTTIAINRGGTGITVSPTNGQFLVGNAGNYSLATLGSTDGISVTNAAGSITINNTGVLRFRANTASTWRQGDVTLSSSDVINALGFVPAVSNTDTWLRSGADLNYYSGNVAIGYSDSVARANGALMVRSTASNPASVLRVENALNTNLGHAFIVTQVANNSASQGYRFMTATGTIPASVDFLNGSILVQTASAYRFGFDGTGSLAVGGTVPAVNKGGTGVHVFGTNAGVTLDNLAGSKWHLGLQPGLAAFGNVRRPGASAFGVFSDEANAGLVWEGQGANTTFSVVQNGVIRQHIYGDGRMAIGGAAGGLGLPPLGGENATLSVNGDVNATGSFTNFSDYRLKHDVQPLEDAMERVMALNPVSFRWNRNDALEEGFLAHELQEVIPTAVQGAKDGVVSQVVDKSQLHPVVVKALQELINKVKQQQEQIDALKTR